MNILNFDDIKNVIISLSLLGMGGFIFIAFIVFCYTISFAIIGWAIVTVVGLFTPVGSVGYFGCTAIGLVACILVAIIRK